MLVQRRRDELTCSTSRNYYVFNKYLRYILIARLAKGLTSLSFYIEFGLS